jgi:hypothetical protein
MSLEVPVARHARVKSSELNEMMGARFAIFFDAPGSKNGKCKVNLARMQRDGDEAVTSKIRPVGDFSALIPGLRR